MRGGLAYIARAKSSDQHIQGYARLHELLDDFTTRPVLDFDPSAASEFDRPTRLKVRVGTMDLRIAAITLAHEGSPLEKSDRLPQSSKVAG